MRFGLAKYLDIKIKFLTNVGSTEHQKSIVHLHYIRHFVCVLCENKNVYV